MNRIVDINYKMYKVDDLLILTNADLDSLIKLYDAKADYILNFLYSSDYDYQIFYPEDITEIKVKKEEEDNELI